MTTNPQEQKVKSIQDDSHFLDELRKLLDETSKEKTENTPPELKLKNNNKNFEEEINSKIDIKSEKIKDDISMELIKTNNNSNNSSETDKDENNTNKNAESNNNNGTINENSNNNFEKSGKIEIKEDESQKNNSTEININKKTSKNIDHIPNSLCLNSCFHWTLKAQIKSKHELPNHFKTKYKFDGSSSYFRKLDYSLLNILHNSLNMTKWNLNSSANNDNQELLNKIKYESENQLKNNTNNRNKISNSPIIGSEKSSIKEILNINYPIDNTKFNYSIIDANLSIKDNLHNIFLLEFDLNQIQEEKNTQTNSIEEETKNQGKSNMKNNLDLRKIDDNCVGNEIYFILNGTFHGSKVFQNDLNFSVEYRDFIKSAQFRIQNYRNKIYEAAKISKTKKNILQNQSIFFGKVLNNINLGIEFSRPPTSEVILTNFNSVVNSHLEINRIFIELTIPKIFINNNLKISNIFEFNKKNEQPKSKNNIQNMPSYDTPKKDNNQNSNINKNNNNNFHNKMTINECFNLLAHLNNNLISPSKNIALNMNISTPPPIMYNLQNPMQNQPNIINIPTPSPTINFQNGMQIPQAPPINLIPSRYMNFQNNINNINFQNTMQNQQKISMNDLQKYFYQQKFNNNINNNINNTFSQIQNPFYSNTPNYPSSPASQINPFCSPQSNNYSPLSASLIMMQAPILGNMMKKSMNMNSSYNMSNFSSPYLGNNSNDQSRSDLKGLNHRKFSENFREKFLIENNDRNYNSHLQTPVMLRHDGDESMSRVNMQPFLSPKSMDQGNCFPVNNNFNLGIKDWKNQFYPQMNQMNNPMTIRQRIIEYNKNEQIQNINNSMNSMNRRNENIGSLNNSISNNSINNMNKFNDMNNSERITIDFNDNDDFDLRIKPMDLNSDNNNRNGIINNNNNQKEVNEKKEQQNIKSIFIYENQNRNNFELFLKSVIPFYKKNSENNIDYNKYKLFQVFDFFKHLSLFSLKNLYYYNEELIENHYSLSLSSLSIKVINKELINKIFQIIKQNNENYKNTELNEKEEVTIQDNLCTLYMTSGNMEIFYSEVKPVHYRLNFTEIIKQIRKSIPFFDEIAIEDINLADSFFAILYNLFKSSTKTIIKTSFIVYYRFSKDVIKENYIDQNLKEIYDRQNIIGVLPLKLNTELFLTRISFKNIFAKRPFLPFGYYNHYFNSDTVLMHNLIYGVLDIGKHTRVTSYDYDYFTRLSKYLIIV